MLSKLFTLLGDARLKPVSRYYCFFCPSSSFSSPLLFLLSDQTGFSLVLSVCRSALIKFLLTSGLINFERAIDSFPNIFRSAVTINTESRAFVAIIGVVMSVVVQGTHPPRPVFLAVIKGSIMLYNTIPIQCVLCKS